MKKESIADKITLVIITYNRYEYLLRLLKYYRSYNSPVKIIVADNSEVKTKNKKLLRLLSSKNVYWKKFDSKISIIEKISRALVEVKTTYSVLTADDDFTILPSLFQCIDFLEHNPDYSAVHGLYFMHSPAERAKRYGFSVNQLYRNSRTSNEESGKERLEAYLTGQSLHTFYSVHRNEEHRLIWRETLKYVSSSLLAELYPTCMSHLYGKIKKMNIFYCSREPAQKPWKTKSYVENEYSSEKINRAVEGLKIHLSKIDIISIEDAESVINRAFERYLTRIAAKYENDSEQPVATDTNRIRSTTNNHNGKVKITYPKKTFFSFFIRLKHFLRLRTRLRQLIKRFELRYTHDIPSEYLLFIYPDYAEDYRRVKKAVVSSGLSSKDLFRKPSI